MRGETELLVLGRFLVSNSASPQLAETLDMQRLAHLENSFMPHVRRKVPRSRLVGVPVDIKGRWRKYTRLYCAYLVASGALTSPCTIYVSIPEQRALEVCLLRTDHRGRIRLLH